MQRPKQPRIAMSDEERRLRSRIGQIARQDGVLHGTLVDRLQVCGKPGCRCARGERHRALVLSVRSEGRTEQIYIPRALEDTVRRWIAQDREIRDLLGALARLHKEKLGHLKARSRSSSDAS